MYSYLQQALPRVVINRTQVVDKKWKLRVQSSPTKENRVHQTAVFKSGLEQKLRVTECLVCCVCVLFFMAKSVKFPHSFILHYAFNSWIEKTRTKTIHCHRENIFLFQ